MTSITPLAGVIGEHIDPAARAVATDLDLRSDVPPGSSQPPDDVSRKRGVGRVALSFAIAEVRGVDVDDEAPAHRANQGGRRRERQVGY